MPDDTKSLARNMLSTLSKADAELFGPCLENFDLKLGDELYSANRRIEYAYFPLSGICSVIAENSEGLRIETGLIGCEGFVGIPIVLFAEKAPSRVIVQAEGRALRISSEKLIDAIDKSPNVRGTGITDVLTYLEGLHAIRALKNRVVILERPILEEIAGASYSVPETNMRGSLGNETHPRHFPSNRDNLASRYGDNGSYV